MVSSVFSTVLDVVMPFIYGFILAYILSFPYNFFYNKCFRKVGLKHEKLKKVKKPLAMLLAYVVCFGIFAFLVGILIPELYNSIVSLVEELPGYMENVKEYMTDILAFIKDKFGFDLYSEDNYNNFMSYLTGKSSSEIINTAITEIFPAALNFASGFATGLYNWIIGIFVSVYMLSSKDKLCRQLRSVVVAYLPLKISRKTIQITELCNKKCGKFLIGKIIDSAIVGVMCFIGLSIFRFDYALLISVVIGITNVIPFFGPFLGAIPCAFLLLLVDPMESFWFIIFII
ncbi:MAG: AI-2E family transporter, partial [Eubacteriales bacterium]|nr:AI-2E family transporter [Eubacteriales bacterium]